MSYDYSKINDKEFEILTCDLLSASLGIRIERFKPGKDKGVDGRFFAHSNNEMIVQCKHYLGSGFKALITKLKNDEFKKVDKLAPSDYIFVTSLPLSRANKSEIYEIFKKYMSSESNIYGQEDLEDLLGRFPKVVEKHYKLWFSSTHVLKTLLNAAIKGRSEFEIERITEQAPLYVETEFHLKAIDLLKDQHVLIITGEPGIGKTTLAENICLYFVSKGFEFLDVECSLTEAESAYEHGTLQIFLFDDFLGSNYLEAIENKKDSHTVKFINRVKNDKTKLFILTSRTNILNSGILHSPYFQNSSIKTSEFQLEVSGMSKLDKAHILYNHMWFSKLTQDFIEEIYSHKRYRKIIEHPNYNPRLVAFITDSSRVPVNSANEYWKYIEDSLSNPKDIWNDCFKRQSNLYVRNLVCLCVFNGGTIEEAEFKSAYSLLIDLERIRTSSHTMKDFDSMIRLCTRAFLNRNRQESTISYTLFNPSLADYIIQEFASDFSKMVLLFESLQTIPAIVNVKALHKQGIISSRLFSTIWQKWFNAAVSSNYSSLWNWLVIQEHLTDATKMERIFEFAKTEQLRAPIDENMSILLNIIWVFHDRMPDSLKTFISRIIGKDSLKKNELSSLAPFVELLFPSGSTEYVKFCTQIKAQIESDVEDAANSMDLSDYINYIGGYDGDGDIKTNPDKVYDELQETAEDSLKELNCSFLEDDIDMEYITEGIDADEMLNEYISKRYDEPDYDDEYRVGRGNVCITDMTDPIDDLFERQ